MDLLDSQTDPESLTAFGVRAVELICSGEFEALTGWIHYALSHGRAPSLAVEADLASSLGVGNRILDAGGASYAVKYFAPNDIPLYALVECRIPTRLGPEVLAELVVFGNERKWLALEQISSELSVTS